jgi:hypothetical protein
MTFPAYCCHRGPLPRCSLSRGAARQGSVTRSKFLSFEMWRHVFWWIVEGLEGCKINLSLQQAVEIHRAMRGSDIRLTDGASLSALRAGRLYPQETSWLPYPKFCFHNITSTKERIDIQIDWCEEFMKYAVEMSSVATIYVKTGSGSQKLLRGGAPQTELRLYKPTLGMQAKMDLREIGRGGLDWGNLA